MANSRGFTIIELLVVLAIIGLLVAAASLSFGSAQRTGRDAQRMGDVLNIAMAVDQTVTATGRYPGDWKNICPNSTRTYSTNVETPDVLLGHGQTKVATGLFRNNQIPMDPAPFYLPNLAITGNGIWPTWGYIYHSHYEDSCYPVTGTSLTDVQQNQATVLHSDYVIELELENPIPPDNTSFKVIDQTVRLRHMPGEIDTDRKYETYAKSRYAYYFAGPFCGSTCYGAMTK